MALQVAIFRVKTRKHRKGVDVIINRSKKENIWMLLSPETDALDNFDYCEENEGCWFFVFTMDGEGYTIDVDEQDTVVLSKMDNRCKFGRRILERKGFEEFE